MKNLIHNIENIFLNTINDFSLINPHDHLLIGLSGGPDSVFLTYLLNKFKNNFSIKITACHINHNLRNLESKRDEEFVRKLCDEWKIPLIIKNIDVINYKNINKLSTEMAARELRYNAFCQISKENNITKIATAHNLDDLIETMLLRLFKGVGISKLISIPVIRNNIIRPILFIPKYDILEYLKLFNIPYVIDSTNYSNNYERNYIRNNIIPLIIKKFPNFYKKTKEFYYILWDEEKFWNEKLKQISNIYKLNNNMIIINKNELKNNNLSLAEIRRLIRFLIHNYIDYEININLSTINKILKFLEYNQGNKIIHQIKDLTIYSSYNNYIIKENQKKFTYLELYVKLNNLNFIDFNNYTIYINSVTQEDLINIKNNNFMIIDTTFNDEIIIRNKKNGDYIYINKNKTKKLKNIFIDNKFNKYQRENSIIFENKNKDIIGFYVNGYGFRVSYKYYINVNNIDFNKNKLVKLTIQEKNYEFN